MVSLPRQGTRRDSRHLRRGVRSIKHIWMQAYRSKLGLETATRVEMRRSAHQVYGAICAKHYH